MPCIQTIVNKYNFIAAKSYKNSLSVHGRNSTIVQFGSLTVNKHSILKQEKREKQDKEKNLQRKKIANKSFNKIY